MLLFTAFEPSGDDHAAVVIEELRRRHPELPMYAWGGPKMARAGATIVESTGDDAVFGVPTVAKVMEHRRINARIAAWMDRHHVAAHIPVDSPAANFPVARLAKQRGVKVIHLVAPQIWAWGSWRIRKLRRLSDLVLCLLPFEEPWFLERGVNARFIGHPLFDKALDVAALDERAAAMPRGTPRIALMPGSRPGEIARSTPTLLDAYRRLKADFPGMAGVFAVTRPEIETSLRREAERSGGWPADLAVVAGETDAVVRWCDMAIMCSGTVMLQIAKQGKLMVAFYRPNLVTYAVGRLLVATDVFTLPNLIAGKRIVPEYIPHFGDGEALAIEVIRLMRQPGYAEDQLAGLALVAEACGERRAGGAAADAIERVLRLRPATGVAPAGA